MRSMKKLFFIKTPYKKKYPKDFWYIFFFYLVPYNLSGHKKTDFFWMKISLSYVRSIVLIGKVSFQIGLKALSGELE